MKRYFKITAFILMFVLFVFFAAACDSGDASTLPTSAPTDSSSDEPTQPVCEHKYDNDCDKDCNLCGEVRVTEHVAQKVDGKTATCTEEGLTAGSKCSVCGETIEAQQIVSALGHNEVQHDGKEATCTESGYKPYVTCDRCDYTTYEKIESLGHNETEHDGLEATCTESGYKPYVTCDRCDYTTYEKIEPLGHNETEHDGMSATCTEGGYKPYVTCDRCDYTNYEAIEALGHNEVCIDGKAPTCTEAGLSDGIICDVCKEALAEQTVLEPTGHIYGSNADSICNVCGDEREFPKVEKFDDIMQNMFSGNHVFSETVMFIDYGQSKKLLYTPDRIISVKSYDMKTTYEEGVDYVLEDGCLIIPEGSRIPCITSQTFYGGPAPGHPDICYFFNDGKLTSSYWGEGNAMTKWQVNVEYTHSDEWEGFLQETMTEQYENFLSKLERGEDVTIFFYGDSITVGANASGFFGTEPNQPPYTLLVVDALARLYGYSVQHANSAITAPQPIDGMNYGDNGVITYINTSTGGWSSADGVSNYGGSNKRVNSYIDKYGCDLFVVAFGMNDGGVAVENTVANIKTMIDQTIQLSEDCAYLIVSTMVPNPDAYGSAQGGKWLGNQPLQEKALIDLAQQYRDSGISCAVAMMTSMSQSILEHKDFVDYTGNNINHPNDFFSRVYAQTIIQTLIGYENIAK